jgi:hypothetical protein
MVVGYSIWRYANYRDYLNKTIHETGRWAVLRDSKGDIMAVEPNSDEVWEQLSDLSVSKEERWIGGIVQEYNNLWVCKNIIIFGAFVLSRIQLSSPLLPLRERNQLFTVSVET